MDRRSAARVTFAAHAPPLRWILVAVSLLAVAVVPAGRVVAAPPTGPITYPGLTAGAEVATPDELKTAAADILARILAPGGGGIECEIQSSTIAARPGGPLVEVPDPVARTRPWGCDTVIL